MAIKNRTDLKTYFVKNAIPTAGNFADLIDSQLNQALDGGDGIFKPDGEALSVVAAPGDQKRVLRLFANYPANPTANPDWMISLNPATAGTSQTGFGITDGAGNTRLFIDPAGRIGVGTNTPNTKVALDVVGDVQANGFRCRYDLVLNDYRTANPTSNVFLHSPPGDRDTWIYRNVVDSGTNWGIYHRQIAATVAGLPGNSIGFVGGGSSKLQAYVNLADGSGFFAGGLSVLGNVTAQGTVGIGTSSPAAGYKLDVHGGVSITGTLTVSGSGRIGVGTTTPQFALDVMGDVQANGFRCRYDAKFNDYQAANPTSNVFLQSPPDGGDTWIYRAGSGTNWGIYHRQIATPVTPVTPVTGLPGNSIGFVGGGSSKLQAYVNLNDGSGFFAGKLRVCDTLTVGTPTVGPLEDKDAGICGTLTVGDWTLTSQGNNLDIKYGDKHVARFSTGFDRLQLFQNWKSKESRFFYNQEGNFPPPKNKWDNWK